MYNVHERQIPVPAAVVGAMLDRLAGDDDPLWPFPAWPPLRFDAPLGVGARGGHGPIRYSVLAYEPGQSVRFTFAPTLGVDGYHELSVHPLDRQRCLLRHVLTGHARGRMRLGWPLAFRWLHDALIEDLLDNAEHAATGSVGRPRRWSPRVRLLRRFGGPRATEVPLPEHAELARGAFERLDFVDAWQVPTGRRMPTDPAVWAQTIFGDAPSWVTALLRLRNELVGLVGIERGDASAFDVRARSEHEALIGTDAGHLDFRASILVQPETVTVSTVVTVHNWRGRLYLLPVRLVHPTIVRALLHRAVGKLAERAAPEVVSV